MQPSSRPRFSLARSTLIKMGMRIAIIIALTTFFSYLHILHTLRAETLSQLYSGVLKRVQREQAIFVLAQDNHALLKQVFEERVRFWRQEDPRAAFDRLFVQLPDGSTRSRLEGFDGTRMPCLFIPQGVNVDARLQCSLLAAHDVLAQYGPAFHVRFTDTYISFPGGAIVLYWPAQPTWCQDATPSFNVNEFDFYALSTPEKDPLRQTVWTGIIADPVAHTWSVSASTPVDLDGQHTATLTHDILIEQLLDRTINEHLPSAYNMLLRDNGELLAHPAMKMNTSASGTSLAEFNPAPFQEHVKSILEAIRRSPEQLIKSLPESNEYAATARIKGPGWIFVTILPEQALSSTALRMSRVFLVLGVLSLLLELGIMYWVLKQQITRPLLSFTRATDQVAAGDFKVSLKTSRDDELGRLAHGFELMAQEVQQREAALRQANEELEIRIQERTQELQKKNLKLEEALAQLEEAQALLVEKEKMASLGALVAGIAHEIKNPLNFVNNFAQLSRGLVEELREELNAHQSGCSASRPPELDDLLALLHQNVSKIDEHGKRADSILRDMQMHSRSAASARKPTDLNALLEEHLGLASGSMQITNPGLQVAIRKELDPTVGRVDLVPQDFGRALLNILSNSLYAVAEKKKNVGEGFTPEVTVSSRSAGTHVEIRIRDNGTGIPQKIHDKIFNPFFTTKPTGSGTGLGLSITYDIVVRQHQGMLRIDSIEGQYTECLIVIQQPTVSA